MKFCMLLVLMQFLCLKTTNGSDRNDMLFSEINPEVQSCGISDLNLTNFESLVQCFPIGDQADGEVKLKTTCLISEDHNGRNQMALMMCLNGKWTETSLGKYKHIQKREIFTITLVVLGLVTGSLVTNTLICRECNSLPIWPQHGYMSCLDKLLGSECTSVCNDGYKLIGNRTVTCQGDSAPNWTETPTCERIRCNEPPTFDNAVISCPSNTFGTICPIKCKSGYKRTGMMYVQCRIDGTWTPIINTACTDHVPPEISCFSPQTFYADRGKSSTKVEWVLPTVIDIMNTDTALNQTSGPAYGSIFKVGSSVVTYMATDSEGNESDKCSIVIHVVETTCQHPYDVLNDTNIDFECSSKYNYGTECELSCRFGISLVGKKRIVCERDDPSNPTSIGSWKWGNEDKPYCDRTQCPILEPPRNGAIARDYIGSTEVYTMMCNEKFTIPEVIPRFYGQWFCQNSGKFSPDIPVPNCVEPRGPRSVNLPSELFYYDGDCSDPMTKEQIFKNMNQILEEYVNPQIRNICPEAYNCTTGNVEITCGKVNERKKRNVRNNDRNKVVFNRQKRNASPTLIISFEIYTAIVPEGNQTISQAVRDTDSLQSGVLVPFIEELVANGTFDLEQFTLRNDSYQSPQYGEISCDLPGYRLRQTICEPCPASYFLNSSEDCELCPVGTYSDEEGLTRCKQCPLGYTTTQTGSKNETQCRELCPVGTYSSDGVMPCIACQVGYFQSSKGKTLCFPCRTGTTELSGSNSSAHCQDFHILVNATNGVGFTGLLSSNLTNVSIMFWTKRFARLPTNLEMALNSDAGNRILIKLTDTVRVVLPDTHIDKFAGDLRSSAWTHTAVTWDSTNSAVRVYVGGQLVINVTSVFAPSMPLIANGTFKLHSYGSTGVFIADLHIEDGVFSPTEINSIINKCWNERPKDVFNMSSFRYKSLNGIEIQTPSLCDPVNECSSNPCHNQIIHNTCVDGLNEYTCYCFDGYTGKNCEVPPDYCVNASCLNGASCVNGINGYTCSCPSGYSGDLCDVEPVNGGWSIWSDWSGCSVSCEEGTQSRTRTCDNPEPSPYGANCTGVSSENQNCSMGNCQECGSLERGYGMLLNCTTDPSTMTKTCEATCLRGFILPDSLRLDTDFVCGKTTGYTWEPMSNPPDCVDPEAPERLAVITKLNTSEPIKDEDRLSYKERVVDNMFDIPCVSDGLCSVSVEILKQEFDGSKIEIGLAINLTVHGPLHIKNYIETTNASESLKELFVSMKSLEKSAAYLNQTSASIFDVTVGETTYRGDISTLSFGGKVTCPIGTTMTASVCAPCPSGTYYKDGNCAFCERGSYCSSLGQTTCTKCPLGLTTITIGSYKASQCTELIPLSPEITREVKMTSETIPAGPHSTETVDIQNDSRNETSVIPFAIIGVAVAGAAAIIFGIITARMVLVKIGGRSAKYRTMNREGRKESEINVRETRNLHSVANIPPKARPTPEVPDSAYLRMDFHLHSAEADGNSQDYASYVYSKIDTSKLERVYYNKGFGDSEIEDISENICKGSGDSENFYLPMDCHLQTLKTEFQSLENEETVYAQIDDSKLDPKPKEF